MAVNVLITFANRECLTSLVHYACVSTPPCRIRKQCWNFLHKALNTDIKFLREVCIWHQHRMTVNVATDNWCHSHIGILSSLVMILVCKHHQQSMTFWWWCC